MSNAWWNQLVSEQQAHRGGVIRRSRRSIDRYFSMEECIEESRALGWQVIDYGDYVLILCGAPEFTWHSSTGAELQLGFGEAAGL